MKKQICKYPFTYVEMNQDGNVSCCCSAYTNEFFFGNIYKKSFEDIWNGDIAQKFRQDIMDGKYSHCNFDMCLGIDDNHDMDYEKASVIAEYPKIVNFSLDNTCNCRCIMCRDKFKKLSPQKAELLDSMIDTHFLPMLKNAELFQLNGEGEMFASEFCKKLIKVAAEKYPNLKFEIITNGTLCNKENLESLGITDRIIRITVSMHAATKETYEKVVRGATFEKTMANIRYLNDLFKSGQIEDLSLAYVISPVNFRELPDFVKLLNELEIVGQLLEFRDWGEASEMNINFYENDILRKDHSNHQEMVKILQDPIFDSEYCLMNDVIRNVQREGQKEKN